MHHTHVHEDLFLWYILFARETHEHEGILPVSTPFALMHIAKIHVTYCFLCHDYALTWSYVPYLHDCIHVGGAYACYMFFQSFICFSLYPYLKLWCMLSSITKKGDIESTSAPWVILVINVNISLFGLILLSSIFQRVHQRHGQEDVEPLQNAKDTGLAPAPTSRLHIFYLGDPRSHWVYRKANTIKGDEVFLNVFLAQSA